MNGAHGQKEVQERLMLADQPLLPVVTPYLADPAETVSRLRTPVERLPELKVRRRLTNLVQTTAQSAGLEADRGAVFLLAPVMLCIGSLVYFAIPFEPGWFPILMVASLPLLVRWTNRQRTVLATACLAVSLLGAGALSGKFENWRSATRVIGGEISTRVTGRVELLEHRENGRVRLTIAVLETERPKLRYQPDRIRLTARKVPIDVRPGSIVTGVARLSQPIGPLRPGAYDFAFENYFDGIGATGFFLRDPEVAVGVSGEQGFMGQLAVAIENMRDKLAQRVRLQIDGSAGEIAAALIAGVRAGIPENTNEVLRITGLAHVLSISGLHMALVAGVVMGSMRYLFALFPAFSSNYPVRKFAAGGALIAVAIYLLISGAAIAAQRSFLMIAVMLVALLFDRAALTMRNLAIAALVILAFAPHEAAGPSFQMSFAATAALIGAYGWWSQRNTQSLPAKRDRNGLVIFAGKKVLFYMAGLVATALIAGAATGIFGAWHFQRVSPLGIPANLLTMPIVSVLVMPFAVLGVLLIPFGLDGPAFWVMGRGLDWMIGIAAWLAAQTPVDAIGAIPVSAVIFLALALVPVTLATTPIWRAAAVPFFALGAVALMTRELPKAFVSEDAKLVAIRLDNGSIGVNRSRPNAFVMKDWRRAMVSSKVVKPAQDQAATDIFKRNVGFTCRDGLCVSAQIGLSIAHARDMIRAEHACGKVDLIVIEDATAANPCPHSSTRVITAKTLALRGSAEISRDGQVTFALPETLRPWHEHRRFSRAARGMAPYVSKSKQSAQPPKPTADTSGQGDRNQVIP